MHDCILAPEYQCVGLYLNYVCMLITSNVLFESESYEPHVIDRAETRLLKVAH